MAATVSTGRFCRDSVMRRRGQRQATPQSVERRWRSGVGAKGRRRTLGEERLLSAELLQHLGGTGEAIAALANGNVEDELLDLQRAHDILRTNEPGGSGGQSLEAAGGRESRLSSMKRRCCSWQAAACECARAAAHAAGMRRTPPPVAPMDGEASRRAGGVRAERALTSAMVAESHVWRLSSPWP